MARGFRGGSAAIVHARASHRAHGPLSPVAACEYGPDDNPSSSWLQPREGAGAGPWRSERSAGFLTRCHLQHAPMTPAAPTYQLPRDSTTRSEDLRSEVLGAQVGRLQTSGSHDMDRPARAPLGAQRTQAATTRGRWPRQSPRATPHPGPPQAMAPGRPGHSRPPMTRSADLTSDPTQAPGPVRTH